MAASYRPLGVEKAAVGSLVYLPVSAVIATDKQGGIVDYCPGVNGEVVAGGGVKGDSAREGLTVIV
ncbi:hypothetical protein ES703_93224 [subsurface metagenome]